MAKNVQELRSRVAICIPTKKIKPQVIAPVGDLLALLVTSDPSEHWRQGEQNKKPITVLAMGFQNINFRVLLNNK